MTNTSKIILTGKNPRVWPQADFVEIVVSLWLTPFLFRIFETELTNEKKFAHSISRLILAGERISSDQSSGRVRSGVAVVVVPARNSDLNNPATI